MDCGWRRTYGTTRLPARVGLNYTLGSSPPVATDVSAKLNGLVFCLLGVLTLLQAPLARKLRSCSQSASP